MRVGAQALSLLSTPRTCLILRALADGPKRQVELRRATGFPAQTTLRGQLKALEDAEVIHRHVRDPFPAVLEYELAEAGRELLPVIDALDRWLAAGPEGTFQLGSDASKAVVKALLESWTSTLLHALAESPRSLTELDRVVDVLSYPALERRLSEMRLAGQIEPLPAGRSGTPYAVSDWMRSAVAPLVAAARWEQRHPPPERAPIAPRDVEAAFLLAGALLRPPSDLSGACRLGVKLPGRSGAGPAGILIEVRDGEVESCSAPPPDEHAASASGPPAAWFGAVIEGDPSELELGGDLGLAGALVESLHNALFPK